MSTQPRTLPTIDDLFGSYQSYAWRLEARDVFNVGIGEDSNVTAWLAGRSRSDRNSDWHLFTRTAREQGKPVSRVRLIGHPVTLYTAWEVSAYTDSIRAGEDVRILDRNQIADDLNPLWDMDFWLFDDQYVVEHRDLALRLSVPYDEYQLPAW